jgi:hypothetical protein
LRLVGARPPIDLKLTIDAQPAVSETTCTWAGAHVLTVHTVIPRFAFELHSTFVGHPGVRTQVVHLRLGPPGHEPEITSTDADDAQLEPTYAPRACAYEHAQRLSTSLRTWAIALVWTCRARARLTRSSESGRGWRSV